MSARGIYFVIPMRLCVFHAHCRDFPKSHVIDTRVWIYVSDVKLLYQPSRMKRIKF